MKVRILTSVFGLDSRGRDYGYRKGAEVELEDFIAKDLVKYGHAEYIKDPVDSYPETVSKVKRGRPASV